MTEDIFISVHDKLSELAKSQPETVAVICADQKYTYREIDEQSDLFSAGLLNLVPDIGRGSFVSILLNRSVFIQVAIMGVLKTGAAFIPFTPDIPAERFKYSVKNAKSKVVVTTQKIKAEHPNLEDSAYHIFTVEEILAKAKQQSLKKPTVHVSPEDIAMCIYTSGSTGKPKGVVLDHRSVYEENCFEHLIVVFSTPAQCLADICPFTYILFYQGFYHCIYSGITQYLNEEDELKDLKKFSEHIYKYKVDNIFAIPSFYDTLLLTTDKDKLKYLKVLVMGGEPLSSEMQRRFFKHLPFITITYGYGTTETSAVSIHTILRSAEDTLTNGVPYHVKAFIVDDNGQELGVNQKGELLLQGKTLSRGYLNNPEETAATFIEYKGERTYKTGDLAYKTENGEYVICERADDMVKVHGQRVELPEIDKALSKMASIRQAKVILKTKEQEKFLVAFVVASEKIDFKELKNELSRVLPPYMIPSFFVQLENMPVNTHGKIDKFVLNSMDIETRTQQSTPSENQIEKTLCNAIKDILDLKEDVLPKDNFFELGGSSISAVELSLEMGKNQLKLTVPDIYLAKTIEKMTEAVKLNKDEIENKKSEAEYRKKSLAVKPETRFFLSEEEKKAEDNYVYNFAYIITLGNKYDEKKFCDAADKIFMKHPMLMTVFSKDSANEYNASYRPDLMRKTEMVQISDKDFKSFIAYPEKNFNLFGEHLYRSMLFVTESNKHFFFEGHHAVGDFYSLHLLMAQIFNEYAGEESGLDFYYTHLQEFENLKHSPKYAQAKEYYNKLKKNIDWCCIINYDKSRPFGKSAYQEYDLKIPLAIMNETEKNLQHSKSIITIAAGIMALSAITGKKKILYTWTYDNRQDGKYMETFGSFAENLPLFIDLEKTDTKEKLLSDISEQVSKGIYYSDCLGDIFYEDDSLDNYSIEIIYEKHFHEDSLLGMLPPKIRIEEVGIHRNAAMPFEIEVRENDNGLGLFIEYAENLYSQEQVLKYADELKKHLDYLIKKV